MSSLSKAQSANPRIGIFLLTYRIGFLGAASASANAARLDAFREGLRELGYIPAMYPRTEYVQDGGLMSYAASLTDLSRRAAIYVDKILKGVKPSDLPVEQPTKFDLMINLNAAKQIGLTIPPKCISQS